MKIYIVDDSDLLRERLIGMIAETDDVNIIGQSESAKVAISEIISKKPDLVFLDIRLPSGSGIEILEAIKNTSNAPTVVMLTNYPYAQYEKKCRDLGADHFLDKSRDFELIPALIADIAKTLQMEPSS